MTGEIKYNSGEQFDVLLFDRQLREAGLKFEMSIEPNLYLTDETMRGYKVTANDNVIGHVFLNSSEGITTVDFWPISGSAAVLYIKPPQSPPQNAVVIESFKDLPKCLENVFETWLKSAKP